MKYTIAGVPQAVMKHHSVAHMNINTKYTNKQKTNTENIFWCTKACNKASDCCSYKYSPEKKSMNCSCCVKAEVAIRFNVYC